MLQLFRNKKRGIFGIVIAGFCALLMVPFGMDMIRRGGTQSSAIQVNDQEISYQEYYRRLSQLQEAFRRQLGNNYQQVASMLNLEQRAADDLINGALVDAFAQDVGLSASMNKIEDSIASHPFFQGVITEGALTSFMRTQGLTSASLEAITRRQLVLDQLQSLFSDIGEPSTPELKAIYTEQNRKAKFRYLEFKPENFASKVDVSKDELLEEFFEEQKEAYRTQRKALFSYVAFVPNEYSDQVEINEDDLKDAYERNKSKFYTQKKVRLKNILIKKENYVLTSTTETENPENAPKDPQADIAAAEAARAAAKNIIKQYDEGATFTNLVEKNSDDDVTKAKGGDLGWLEFSALEPATRTAVADLEVGAISEVTETKRGFEIFRVEDIQERRLKPLSEVEQEVKAILQKEDSPDYARIAAEDFFEALLEEDVKNPEISIVDFAKQKGKNVINSDKPLGEREPSGSIPPQLVTKVLEFNADSLETVSIGDTSYVVQVVETFEPTIPEFKEVKQKVIEDFKNTKSKDLAKEAAENALAKIEEQSGKLDLAALGAEQSITAQSTDLIGRSDNAQPPFVDPAVKNIAFSLSQDSPFAKKVVSSGGSYYVLELVESSLPDTGTFAQERDKLSESEKERVSNRMLGSLFETLRAGAETKVNPDLFDKGQR
jgi:peptidyl-prolyl cis-trans isomerase D